MFGAIIACEVTCIIVNIILLYGNIFEIKDHTHRSSAFTIVLLLNLIGTIFDVVSYILDGNPETYIIEYCLSFFSIIMTFAVSAEYVYFLYLHISSKLKVSSKPFFFMINYLVIASILCIILTAFGKLFSVENGYYVEGPYYSTYVVSVYASIAFGIIIAFIYKKSLKPHDFGAILSFFIFPVISGILYLIVGQYSYGYAATTMALLIAYLMLRSENEQHLFDKEVEKNKIATHDELTGLLNRYAYASFVDRYTSSQGMLGVVYSDINGLKYTNDTFGHEAGDKIICDFSCILKSCFREDEIFRISGDEFVVMLPGITESALAARFEKLRTIIEDDNRHIAAIGYSMGDKTKIDELIKEAEHKMYIDKQETYSKYPYMKRKA